MNGDVFFYFLEISESYRWFGRQWRPVVFLMVLLVVGVAQPAMAEDLMQVYRLALKNDPVFQGEGFRHEASMEGLSQAYSELMPTITADGSYGYTRQKIYNTDVAVFGSKLAHYATKRYGLKLTQPIFRYSTIMHVLQAKEGVRQADLKLEAARQDLMLRVAEAFITALEARDNFEFTRAEEKAVKLHFELAKARFKNGLAPITDFHDAKARLANVTAQRVMAENKVDDSLEALAEIAGRAIENPARLKSGLETAASEGAGDDGTRPGPGGMPLLCPEPDNVDTWTDAALKQNLELKALRKAVLVAKREIDRQKAGHWPTVAIVGQMNREDEGGSLFGGDSDVGTSEAILQLNIPIFQGFSVLSKTREARNRYLAARQDLVKQARSVKRKARAAFFGVKGFIRNAEAFRQSVVSNQIALEAKREGFKSGLFPSLAVLDAERDLYKARMGYANAQYQYILESFRLKLAVGTLSEEDLAGINKWFE